MDLEWCRKNIRGFAYNNDCVVRAKNDEFANRVKFGKLPEADRLRNENAKLRSALLCVTTSFSEALGEIVHGEFKFVAKNMSMKIWNEQIERGRELL
jgi:hypothetical protein